MKKETRRVFIDIVLFVGILFIFQTRLYEYLTPPDQLFSLKMMLISGGILHAHIIGKRIFPTVDWSVKIKEQTGAYSARIIFYFIIPLCYAFGG